MKRLLVAALACVLLAPAAYAAERGGRPQAQPQGQPAKKAQNPPQHKGHDKRHANKLSDDERRQLRQDVDRADREIYRR